MQSKDNIMLEQFFMGCQSGAGLEFSIQCLECPCLLKFRGQFCWGFQVFSLLLDRREVSMHRTATHISPSSVKRWRGLRSSGGHPIHSL